MGLCVVNIAKIFSGPFKSSIMEIAANGLYLLWKKIRWKIILHSAYLHIVNSFAILIIYSSLFGWRFLLSLYSCGGPNWFLILRLPVITCPLQIQHDLFLYEVHARGIRMHLLDGNYTDRMERGTPQRKTVYRISLTLVKKESLSDGTGNADGGTANRRLENPKVGAYRHEGSACRLVWLSLWLSSSRASESLQRWSWSPQCAAPSLGFGADLLD